MERHLLETKERGNLSFSKDDDFCMAVENETAEASRDHSLVASVTSNDNPLRSQLAVLFEAGKALDRAKQTEKELNFANQLIQGQVKFDKNKEGKI